MTANVFPHNLGRSATVDLVADPVSLTPLFVSGIEIIRDTALRYPDNDVMVISVFGDRPVNVK